MKLLEEARGAGNDCNGAGNPCRLYRLACFSFVFYSLVFHTHHACGQPRWKKSVLGYTSRLARSDGGYGWKDQPDSHLTPTFAVVGILHDLNALPADRKPLIHFILTHHPQYGAKAIQALEYKQQHHVEYLSAWTTKSEAGASGSDMKDLIYQQIQAVRWLNGNADGYDTLVSRWKSQAGNLANYEKHGYPVFMQYMMNPVCRHLLHLPVTDATAMITYLRSRRRRNGSFNNAPAAEGGDGNILNTYWGLEALNILGEGEPMKEATIDWIRSCQLEDGGFSWQPHPSVGANDEVSYTWAAVKALKLLAAKPADEKGCIRYLLSLRNGDGGFGNRPGLPSTPMSTYYAIDALKALHALGELGNAAPARTADNKADDFSGLHIYSAQFEAPGVGSPSEAVMLADRLHIQLWGCKNGPPGWVEAARRIAKKKNVHVTFFIADEPYGKYVDIPGMGTFGHVLDFMAPAGAKLPAIGDDPSWAAYRHNYVQPLLKEGGALLLQISDNEPLARILLDESVNRGGYAAISTIHFVQNFLFWVPYLYQYRYQLPFIALQDAHGTESWWWTDELLGYRTLFLAKEPTYKGMMQALKHHWVVAVRHDSLSHFRSRMLGGAPGVQQYVRDHQNSWKWWSTDPGDLIRPWAAITVVRPSDSFEVARPEKGVNIRIRCWWKASRPVLKVPVVQLKSLSVDGVAVHPRHVIRKGRRGRLTDAYYLYSLPAPAAGAHLISATLVNGASHQQRVIRRKFSISK